MENSKLGGRILMEMENLIAQSCPQQKVDQHFENLHVAIIKKHYNATEVSIDYHRRRVVMDVVMNEQDYDPMTVNLHMRTLRVNLWFRNLCDFLKSCLDYDSRSVAVYAGLLNTHEKKATPLLTA